MLFVTQQNLLIPTINCLHVLGEARRALCICLHALRGQEPALFASNGLPLSVTLRSSIPGKTLMGILPFSGAGAAAKAVGHGKEECYKNKRGSWASHSERKEGWGIYGEEWERGAMVRKPDLAFLPGRVGGVWSGSTAGDQGRAGMVPVVMGNEESGVAASVGQVEEGHLEDCSIFPFSGLVCPDFTSRQ